MRCIVNRVITQILFAVILKIVLLQELPTRFRLPHSVKPKSYDIEIKPVVDRNYFLGEVIIIIEVQHSLEAIILNSKNLKIISIVLDNCMNCTGYIEDGIYELLYIFHTDRKYIDPGEHFIYIEFAGVITSNGTGIFKSGDTIATSFSTSNARMAFPCFDEPDFRAKFSFRLIKPDDTYEVLTNMEKINSFSTDDGVVVDFRTTPPISPYLLCFVITKYKNRFTRYRSEDGRVISIRLFMMDEYMDQASFLLNVAKNALSFSEDYTNLTYPLSKLDIIELRNFNFQGMENIGLITLRHNAVSFNKSLNLTEIDHQRNAALLIVHEISHMWFGNIVTHQWYNDLWLSEGFAQFMEQKVLLHIYPEWKVLKTEAVTRENYALNYDISSANISPVIVFPNSQEEAEAQFRELVYTKGSAILKMTELIMGHESFKIGIRNYLKKYYFDTVTTGNFISTMQKSSPHLNLWGFLQSWLYQNRFPLVIVINNSTDNYVLQQRNFNIARNLHSIFEHKWTIPITYTSSCNKNMSMEWFDKDAVELYITKCKGDKWIKFNHKGIGYYRVLYTEEHYRQLLDHFEELSEIDQGNLIDETFHLMRELQVSCKIPIKFLEKMKNRSDFIPVLASIENFKIISADVKIRPEIFGKLSEYFIRIFENLYENLSWRVGAKDDYNTRILRSSLLDAMCGMKYKKCFYDVANIIKEGVEIHPDVMNTFTDISALIGSTRRKKTILKFPDVKSLASLFFREKISIPFYVEICTPWIINNL